MANINIEIPDDLHKELKINAAEKDSTLKELIIAILEQQCP
jgi:predicted HicB family RNase H-like nuclease